MTNMEVPPNVAPESVQTFFSAVIDLLSNYGWTILFVIVVLNLLWSHFYPKYRKWKDEQEDQEKEEELRQNPDLILSRQEALELSRQRLQEQHDRLAKEHDEKMRRREEEKRQEKIATYERLMAKPANSNQSQSLRGNNYNPLMGSGPSCNYRPSRRGGSSGGG